MFLSIALIALFSISAVGQVPTIATNAVVESGFTHDTTTTFLLVRHAEKVDNSTNPDLSAEGQARAEKLSWVLSNVPLDAVFSTNYSRTIQTAQPTATQKSLSIDVYDPSDLAAFADEVLANYPNGTVLVVGHSNTTPSLLNVLAGTDAYHNLPDAEYDNLFIVKVFKRGHAEIINLKFGN